LDTQADQTAVALQPIVQSMAQVSVQAVGDAASTEEAQMDNFGTPNHDNPQEIKVSVQAVGEAASTDGAQVSEQAVGEAASTDGAAKPIMSEEVLELEILHIVRGAPDLEAVTLKQLRAELEKNLMLEAGSLEQQKSHIGTLAAKAVQQVRKELPPDLGGHTPRKESRQKAKWQQDTDASARKKKRRHSKAEAGLPIKGCLQVLVGNESVEAPAKAFASGKSGFFACERLELNVDGRPRQAQCLVQCVLLD